MVGGCEGSYMTSQSYMYYYKFLLYWIPKRNQVERLHIYTLEEAGFDLTKGHYLVLDLHVQVE